ncbi:MAG: hypothetical protein KIT14_02670 [bacterium]|nr:hypothetical protein [bacterium]
MLPGPLLDVAAGVADGSLDASVGIVRDVAAAPGLHVQRLFASRLVGIVRRRHPALRAGRITLRDYVAADHVVVTERPGASGAVDEELARRGLRRHVAARVPRAPLVPPLIAASDLVAAVSDDIAAPYARLLPLEIFPLSVPLPVGRVALVWHERTAHDPARAFLRRLIGEAAADLRRVPPLSRRRARARSA